MKRNVSSKFLRVTKAAQPGLALMLMGIGGFMTACGDGKPKPAHLDVAEDAPSPEQDSWLREQRLMRIKYVPVNGAVTTRESSINDAVSMLYSVCSNLAMSGTTCADKYSLELSWHMCMARNAMAIATTQSDPITLPIGTSQDKYVIDNVTEANAAGMAAAASEYARYVVHMATKWLIAPPATTPANNCRTSGGAWLTSPATNRAWSLEFATSAVEGYYLSRGAMERAVEATLNIADKARSSTISAEVARERSVLGEEFSRVSAAHMLVGGVDGLLGSTKQGYCSKQDLPPQAQAAVQLLRDAAPPPNLLFGNDINLLLNGSSWTDPLLPASPACPECGGSVRQRLGAFNSIVPLSGGQDVQSFYDLTTQDFTKARDYLRQEYTTFGRSRFARGPKFPATGTGFARYGGTGGGGVSPLPAGGWAARARYNTIWPSKWYDPNTGVYLLGPRGSDPGYYISPSFDWAPLETMIAGTYHAFRDVLKSTDHFSTTAGATVPNAFSNEVHGILASVMTAGEYKGTLELYGTATTLRGYGHGYKAADKIRVMVGEEGLRCAVERTIEGAACEDPTTLTAGAHYNCPLWYPGCSAATPMPAECLANPGTFSCLTAQVVTGEDTTTTYYGTQGYAGNATGRTGILTNQLTSDKTRLYFVKLKDPLLPEKPGNYELLGGTTFALGQWMTVPVIPLLNERVDQILAPNRKNCAIPNVSCMGTTFDARLPLEDELTGDGDKVENSWQHYLGLAKQAAAESDLLGREFRDAKLNKLQGEAAKAQRLEEQRQAAETAIEEVQAMCGTAIDSRKLLDYFSGNDSTNLDGVLQVGTCSPTMACAVAGSICMGGRCVKDPAKLTADPLFAGDPDAKRLEECLNPAVEQFSSLGSEEICVYTSTSRPGEACPTSGPGALPTGTQCPAPVGSCSPPSGFVSTLAKPLSYFVNKKPLVQTFNACVALRKARFRRTSALYEADGKTPTPYADVSGAEVFKAGHFSDTVGRLGFVSKYGSYFDIIEQGTPRWSSGSLLKGSVSGGWPHGPISECTADQTGLFCTTFPPVTVAPWTGVSSMHTRVLGAVAAAAAIRSATNPSQKGMDITYPSVANWTVGKATIGMVRQGTTPVSIATRPVNPATRGTRTTYTWIQPTGDGERLPWIGPDGATYASSSALHFFGPFDGNVQHPAEFAPVLNPPQHTIEKVIYEPSIIIIREPYGAKPDANWGRPDGFDRVLATISGGMTEAQTGRAVGFNARQTGNLYALLKQPAQPIGYDFDATALLDGYELLCELDRLQQSGNFKPTIPASGPADAAQMGAYLQDLADQIETSSALVTFANIPTIAFDALKANGSTGSLSNVSGEMRQAIEGVRASFVTIQSALPVMGAQLRLMGAANEQLEAELDLANATKSLQHLEAQIAMADMAINCATAVMGAISPWAAVGAAARACGSLANHVAHSAQKADLQDRIADNTGKIARAQFSEKMTQLALTMQTTALGLEDSIETVRANIAVIDSLRKRASLALAKAVYLASYQNEQQAVYDQSVGALTDLQQKRYIEALKNAKLMSFFARRAIEQRLGVNLTDMRDALPLVAAPQTWEGEACSMGGIDGLSDKSATPSSPGQPADWIAVYGQGFIGEYVNKLERTVESYRLAHNFHEGNDVAVISLRDDVFDIRTKCEKPSKNLFRSAADMTNAAAWGAQKCNAVTINGVSEPAANCIQAVPCLESCEHNLAVPPGGLLRVPDLAVKGLRSAQDGALGHFIRFGDGQTCSVAGYPCGWKAATTAGAWPSTASALSQILTLQAGKYRISWYTKDSTAPAVSAAKVGFIALRPVADALGYVAPQPAVPTNFVAPFTDQGAGLNWKRVSAEFTITTAGDYEVGFGANVTTRPTDATQVTVGGPMLELIPSSGPGVFNRSFQATDGEGMTSWNDCEDKGGLKFRNDTWRRQCVHLCDEGFTGNCTTGPEYCYREFTFGVAQPWVASGKLFKYSGFARGNFNYRIDSLALNFVGSQTRDCSDTNLPSTCYNAGFVPYSIQHNGPFYTRNHAGADVQAMLFDGRIEHARGLALERYVTNPIASTDRELLTDYMRSEFAGRPLDGSFTVKLWEEPGVNLDGVEDVQLVLNYRYWTAND